MAGTPSFQESCDTVLALAARYLFKVSVLGAWPRGSRSRWCDNLVASNHRGVWASPRINGAEFYETDQKGVVASYQGMSSSKTEYYRARAEDVARRLHWLEAAARWISFAREQGVLPPRQSGQDALE